MAGDSADKLAEGPQMPGGVQDLIQTMSNQGGPIDLPMPGEQDVGGGSSSQTGDVDGADVGARNDEPRIPKARFDDLNVRRKQAEKKAEKLEKELAEARKQIEDQKTAKELDALVTGADRPSGFEDWPFEQQRQWELRKTLELAQKTAPQPATSDVSKLEREVERLKVDRMFGGQLSFDQIDAIVDLRDKTGIDDARELYFLATNRIPDLFPARPGGAAPPAGYVNEPGRGRRESPKRTSAADIAKQMRSAHASDVHSTLGPALVRSLIEEQVLQEE